MFERFHSLFSYVVVFKTCLISDEIHHAIFFYSRPATWNSLRFIFHYQVRSSCIFVKIAKAGQTVQDKLFWVTCELNYELRSFIPSLSCIISFNNNFKAYQLFFSRLSLFDLGNRLWTSRSSLHTLMWPYMVLILCFLVVLYEIYLNKLKSRNLTSAHRLDINTLSTYNF